jgi:hypothetical protein
MENEAVGTYGTYGEAEGGIQDLVERPEGKRPLARPGRTWKDNLKVKLK